MAQPALESFRKRGIALKIESTPGVDANPSTSLNGIRLFDGRSGTEFDRVERNIDRPFFTGNPFIVANKRAFIEGGFELYPPSAPGQAVNGNADCEPLLLPAGMAVTKDDTAKTTRYTPISAAIPTATAYWWHVDSHIKVLGARHQITGLRLAVGERFTGQVRVEGSYTVVEKQTLPTITLPSTVPLVVQAANSQTHVAVDGGSDLLVWAKELSIDFNSALGSKEYTSHKENAISDRQATFRLRIARTDLADFNPWTVRDEHSLFEARLRLDEGDDIYSELGIRGQIETIEPVDIDGDLGWELSGPCIASDAGGDEFYVEFGDTSV